MGTVTWNLAQLLWSAMVFAWGLAIGCLLERRAWERIEARRREFELRGARAGVVKYLELGHRGIGVALALLLAAPAGAQVPDTQLGASAPQAVGLSYRWSSDATTEYLAKAGNDREVIFGARIEGAVIAGRWTTALRLQASAKPDGGAQPGSVSFSDPHTFDSLGGYLSLGFLVHQAGPLLVSLACVGGIEADIEGGRVRVFDQYPLTYGCGTRLDVAGAYVYVLAGEHQAAGPGLKGLLTLRISTPFKRASIIANGALGGERSFLLAGVALGVGGSK